MKSSAFPEVFVRRQSFKKSKNFVKAKTGSFYGLTFVSYYFASFKVLKTKTGYFSAFLFMASKTKMASFLDLIRTLFLVLLLGF